MSGFRIVTNRHTAYQWYFVGLCVGFGLVIGGLSAIAAAGLVAKLVGYVVGVFQ